MRRTAALIVGGGPAGSAAAIGLARAGPALLIERTSGDRERLRRVSRLGCVAGLAARAGLPPRWARDRSAGCGRSRATARSRRTCRRPAAGLPRRRLDAALRAAAEQAGTISHCGRAAGAPRRAGLAAASSRRPRPRPAAVPFLATGKHAFRGAARPLEGRREPPAAGLRARAAGAARSGSAIGRDDRAASLRRRLCRPAAPGGRHAPISACRSRGRGWPSRRARGAARRPGSPRRRSSPSGSAAACRRAGRRSPACLMAGAPRATRAGPVPGRRPGGGDRLARRRRHRHRPDQRRGGGPRPACTAAPARPPTISAASRARAAPAGRRSPRRFATTAERRVGARAMMQLMRLVRAGRASPRG